MHGGRSADKIGMKRQPSCMVLAFLAWFLGFQVLPIFSGDITGQINITKSLTKKRVALTPYAQRGVALPLLSQSPVAARDELSRVVIYLEGPGVKPVMPTSAQLNQHNRSFEPEIVVVPVGSTVSFPNSDPIFHNVFSLSKPKSFDLGYYPEGQTRKLTFDKPGVIQVFCHLHSNMTAAIVVTPNEWSTRPRDDGTFSLNSIPPGKYQLVVWHKSAGFFQRKVEVKPNAAAVLNFEIPLREQP
jgi:plastocyanin